MSAHLHRGRLVAREDDGYDDARAIYNLLHDRRPSLIARVTSTADVVEALQPGRQDDLEIAVRSGGHSIAGYGSTEGGLVIDVRGIDHVEIDVESQRARVGAGVTAGDLTEALARHGLVVPLGDNASVGVAGITLGGGIGWLSRKLGLTVDSLERAAMVTADGDVVTAGHGENEDLFWALRGGGGNFGVVTELTYRLHPLGAVLGGVLALPASTGVLRALLDLAVTAPDELGIIVLVTRLPPFDFVAPDHHGRPTVLVTLVWCGDIDEGIRHVDRIKELAPVLVDDVRARPYSEMYTVLADAPVSITNITTNSFADELDDEAIAAVIDAIDRTAEDGAVLAAVELRVLGGAIARQSVAATSYAHRDRRFIYSVVTAGFPVAKAADHRAWVDSVGERLRRLSTGAYVNFLDASEEHRLDEVYPPDVRRRLGHVKGLYDPRNRFHRNLTIPAT